MVFLSTSYYNYYEYIIFQKKNIKLLEKITLAQNRRSLLTEFDPCNHSNTVLGSLSAFQTPYLMVFKGLLSSGLVTICPCVQKDYFSMWQAAERARRRLKRKANLVICNPTKLARTSGRFLTRRSSRMCYPTVVLTAAIQLITTRSTLGL